MATSLHASAGRIALVTGGVRRIGRAICCALARHGYGVVVHGSRLDDDTRALLQEIRTSGGPGEFVEADLANPSAVDTLIDRAAAAAGPIGLLVNNASVFEDDSVGALDAESWDRHFAVNLRAPIFLAQAFVAQTPAGDPSIVNITDQRVRKPVPRQFSYTLTKCALDAATVMLAQALAPRVRVNAVAPGPTLPSPRQAPVAFAAQQAALPLARGPRPEDIADAVVYLASAMHVTGTTIPVDGGQHIAWKTPDAFGIDE